MSTRLPFSSCTSIAILAVAIGALLAGCGGSSTTPEMETPSEPERIAAAAATASNNPQCSLSEIGPFYWEIGDANGVRASGSVGAGAPSATTAMRIFSASKWVYAAYVVQKRGLRADDVPYLNFTAGYTQNENMLCPLAATVADCQLPTSRNTAAVDRYFYASGHMQQHAAAVMGLGAATRASLAAEIRVTIGDFGFGYEQPQLASGITGTPAGYGAFLRRLLRGELMLGTALGLNKVCTNPMTCPTALSTPMPTLESWNYSLGHWVEDDPAVGDHAFSSAGGGGFYPWIDSTRQTYGLLARERIENNAGFHSAECGRLIRQAWRTGVPAISGVPTP